MRDTHDAIVVKSLDLLRIGSGTLKYQPERPDLPSQPRQRPQFFHANRAAHLLTRALHQEGLWRIVARAPHQRVQILSSVGTRLPNSPITANAPDSVSAAAR